MYFVVQTIEDLVLASQRNLRVRSRQEGQIQTIEKKNEETLKTLEKAKAEIQRLKVGWGSNVAMVVTCSFIFLLCRILAGFAERGKRKR